MIAVDAHNWFTRASHIAMQKADLSSPRVSSRKSIIISVIAAMSVRGIAAEEEEEQASVLAAACSSSSDRECIVGRRCFDDEPIVICNALRISDAEALFF